MTKRIQILVIEDNRLLRDGLAALLDSQSGFKVVASAEGASTALQRLQEQKPHVVLVDAALGRNRSQRLVESIKEAAPHSRIIMMDMLPEEEDVIDFIKRGANGFIAKDAALEDLVDTIRQVANAALTAPLGRLIAIAENYPQLKSNENFRALQDQLEGTENRIAVARQDYNETVNGYNAYIRRFPQVLTAKVLGKKSRPYFELQTPGAAEAPKVDFSR